MPDIGHVLVPTDGSEGALKAATYAGEFARALDARVTVLYVLDDNLVMPHAWGAGEFPYEAAAGSMSVEEIRNMLEQRVREKELADTVEALGRLHAEAQTTVVWGHPAQTISKFAAEQGVDLIVIGSHGRAGIKRVLLGSVSHAVAHHATCPVTIVR